MPGSLILNLILAHLIGDFLLQPNKWVINKQKNTWKSPYLYYHIQVHAIALMILLGFNIQKYGIAILVICLSHYVIDLAKICLVTSKMKKDGL